MRKILMVLIVLTTLVSSAAFARAGILNCAGASGDIIRGCEAGGNDCAPFDFENNLNYCSASLTPNRAVFLIWDCIEDGYFETVVEGDVIEVSMEILVDRGAGKVAGDNGVYWAENISNNGVALGTYDYQMSACTANSAYDTYYSGLYDYLTAAGTIGSPISSDICAVAAANRVVKIVPRKGQALGTFGYKVTVDDEIYGNDSWAIDIPKMRVDSSRVSGGEKVWVKICLSRNCSGTCSEEMCCYEIYIGSLCCKVNPPSNNAIPLAGPMLMLLSD